MLSSFPLPLTLQWMQNAINLTNNLFDSVKAERQQQNAAVQALGGGGGGSGGSANKKGVAKRR